MKKAFSILTLFIITALACVSCVSVTVVPPAIPATLPPDAQLPATTVPSITPEPATPTPEILIARTQAVPAQIQLNGISLAVQGARLGACDLHNCPIAPDGTRYLAVTLQAQNLPSDQSLDYKNLPQGIAIHDNTGAMTTLNRLAKYAPELQRLTLYFTIPQTATAFGLQWPGAAETPLTVTIVAEPTPVSWTTTFYGITLNIPQAIASEASGGEDARLDSPDAAYWQKTPGHRYISLSNNYILQGKTYQPVIYVYPASGYAELVPGAFESVRRLDNILYSLGGLSLSADRLPTVPFFNAQQIFTSNARIISFQNGSGVRFITEYAQYPASANNQDLFYNFQGVTRDGAYYIVAIFPITVPVLADTSDAGAVLPAGGIPYPYMANPKADMNPYYAAVTSLLNTTSPDAFSPTLGQLDLLIQSMQVVP